MFARFNWNKEKLECSDVTIRDKAHIQVISRLNESCRTGDIKDLDEVLSDEAFSTCANDVKVAIINGEKLGGGNYP